MKKVYLLTCEWVFDGESGLASWIFEKIEDAKTEMRIEIEEDKANGAIKKDWIVDEGEFYYEAYEDDYYSQNHVNYKIEEKEILKKSSRA